MGAVIGAEAIEEAVNVRTTWEMELDLEGMSPRDREGIACTVVRVYRRDVRPDFRGRSDWTANPNEGVVVVAVYHTPAKRAKYAKHSRRIRWMEVLRDLEYHLDRPASRANFHRAVQVQLGEAWGEGAGSKAFQRDGWPAAPPVGTQPGRAVRRGVGTARMAPAMENSRRRRVTMTTDDGITGAGGRGAGRRHEARVR